MLPSDFMQRRIAFYLIASIIFASIMLSTRTMVRAQTIVPCAASTTALGGVYVTVNADQEQVNVRSGPNSYQYGKIGVLYTYESAPALGLSPGGDWIQISCPGAPGDIGWVYAANLTLIAQSDLPVIEIPATSTAIITSTMDPVLAAEFPIIQPTTTRLPTFTPAAPQPPLFYTDAPTHRLNRSLSGSLIIGVIAIGMMALLFSFFQTR